MTTVERPSSDDAWLHKLLDFLPQEKLDSLPKVPSLLYWGSVGSALERELKNSLDLNPKPGIFYKIEDILYYNTPGSIVQNTFYLMHLAGMRLVGKGEINYVGSSKAYPIKLDRVNSSIVFERYDGATKDLYHGALSRLLAKTNAYLRRCELPTIPRYANKP